MNSCRACGCAWLVNVWVQCTELYIKESGNTPGSREPISCEAGVLLHILSCWAREFVLTVGNFYVWMNSRRPDQCSNILNLSPECVDLYVSGDVVRRHEQIRIYKLWLFCIRGNS